MSWATTVLRMIVGSFNVENLFRRPKVLNNETWAEGEPILEKFSAAQLLLEKAVYSAADKSKIAQMLGQFGLDKTDEGPFVILRRSRGQLVSRPRSGGLDVIATGRGDWIGWLELKREAVNEIATRNTARVIADVNADVLVVVEAEDRPALQRFNNDVFGTMQTKTLGKKAWTYAHTMLIDGNDDRGIDVGLFAKDGFDIGIMRSHVDDVDKKGNPIFSRDCAEFVIRTPGGDEVLFLANHFKSKGYGKASDSDARRTAQAARVADIYEQHRAAGVTNVIVAGDLNDTPDSAPLKALVRDTDLVDVSTLDNFADGGRTGTYGTGSDKIDYLLCSPELINKVQRGGIFRTGVWHGPKVKNPWPMYDTLTKPEEGASDHAAIWTELDLD
jgi:endonuclease/exonuclease/phosphatase family metal-dependent hydrolase